MEFRYFLRQLLIAVGISVAGILFAGQWPGWKSGIPLAWASLLFFILFSLFSFMLALHTAKSTKKERFITLIMGLTLLKMFFAFVMVAIYVKVKHPDSRLFAIPFFGIYLIFTIFESAFLIRTGKG
jgi:hypothetical protein